LEEVTSTRSEVEVDKRAVVARANGFVSEPFSDSEVDSILSRLVSEQRITMVEENSIYL